MLSPAQALVQWASSDESVAAVDAQGRVTAKTPGACTITATSGEKSAECAVSVGEEACCTVIYAAKPAKSDGNTPPEPPQGGDGEIPIELPPEVIDVEHIPEAEEFLWRLEFDEPFSTEITTDGITLLAEVTITFQAEKQGGKTAVGTYQGTFSGDADLNAEHFLAVMNQQMGGEGGKITDYTETDEGFQALPIQVTVTPMDDAAYHEVLVGHVKDKTITQQLPVPISDLFPGAMMALGEVSGVMTISGTMTIEAAGQTITAPFGTTQSDVQPYTICIYPSGEATLNFPLMTQSGFARDWVEGRLTRLPLV